MLARQEVLKTLVPLLYRRDSGEGKKNTHIAGGHRSGVAAKSTVKTYRVFSHSPRIVCPHGSVNKYLVVVVAYKCSM